MLLPAMFSGRAPVAWKTATFADKYLVVNFHSLSLSGPPLVCKPTLLISTDTLSSYEFQVSLHASTSMVADMEYVYGNSILPGRWHLSARKHTHLFSWYPKIQIACVIMLVDIKNVTV